MRIAIVGGTFNPPHLGHKNIIEESSKLFDKVLIIPNNIPSHKDIDCNKPEFRLKMCEIMCKDIAKTEVLDIELKLGGKSYSIDTLHALKEVYKNDEIYFVIGTDSFKTFEKWKCFEEILKLVTLVVFNRDTDSNLQNHKTYLSEKYGAKVDIIQSKIVKISSSDIRHNISTEYLDENVYEFIKQNRLYEV